MQHPAPYGRLAAMSALSFVAMYVIMYAMVDVPGNIYPNLNQLYMVGMMTVPMVIFELWLMKEMYPSERTNLLIIAASIAALALLFFFIRQQTAIADEEFLRSMIPHHAGAILMCEEAAITDPEIQTLCDQIIKGQQAEIEQMKGILERLN